MIYNEAEAGASAVFDQLESHGLELFVWRRDVPPGEPLDSFERHQLSMARCAVVLLGRKGWGANHLRLALEAEATGKRIIPVLMDRTNDAMLQEAGGLFQRLLRVELRAKSFDRDIAVIADAIRSTRPDGAAGADFDLVVSTLIDGSDADRMRLLDEIATGRVPPDRHLCDRLIFEIEERFSPADPDARSTERDRGRIPSIRSWMFSALIGLDAEYIAVRSATLQHLNPAYETAAGVRFWILAGLASRHVTYLEAACSSSAEDPAEDVRMLAQAVLSPEYFLPEARRQLASPDGFWRGVHPVLRALRIVAAPDLLPDIYGLLGQTVEKLSVDYDVLYAMAHPQVARASAEMLEAGPGVTGTLDVMARVARDSDPSALRAFARIVAAFDPAKVRAAVAELARRAPDLAGRARSLESAAAIWRQGQPAGGLYIAGFQSDTIDASRDYLDIREDVETLTAVMLAREVKPPLAIGLFGDWGSGKSFFMQAMRQASKRLMTSGSPRFCTDVAAIEFNAWHYADTNLWASLVSHILEKLAHHVSPAATPEEQHADLIRDLASAQEALAAVQAEQDAARAQLEQRQAELQKLQADRETKELQLRELRLQDFQEVLKGEAGLEDLLKQALEDLGAPAALGAAEELRGVVAEINTQRGRMAAFRVALIKGPGWKVRVLLVAVVIAGPPGLYWLYGLVAPALQMFGTVVSSVAVSAVAAVPYVRQAMQWVRKRMDTLESARSKVEAALAKRRTEPTVAEKQLQKDIADLKAKEDQEAGRLRAASEKVIGLEQQLHDLQENRSLVRFLSDRTSSDDYRRHLGLVSTVRRDFEALAARLDEPLTGGRRVERIVLYIDDLDRCPPDKVVDVLEAVHLLLAWPLFVVVVGVDPRWLAHALSEANGAFGRDGRTGATAGWQTTPQDYLEKIFQIPINLRRMTDQGFGRLMGSLLASGTPVEPAGEGGRAEPPPEAPRPHRRGRPAKNDAGPAAADAAPEAQADTAPLQLAERALSISPQEVTFAERLHALLPSPRAAKRFANTWRLVKAAVPEPRLAHFEGSEASPGTFRLPMLLLASVVGAPRAAAVLLPQLRAFALARRAFPTEVAPDIAAEHSAVVAEILSLLGEPGFPDSPEEFLEWAPKVSRFSFDIGRTFDSAPGRSGDAAAVEAR